MHIIMFLLKFCLHHVISFICQILRKIAFNFIFRKFYVCTSFVIIGMTEE